MHAKARTSTETVRPSVRYAQLKQLLEERRTALVADVQDRMRTVRDRCGTALGAGCDEGEVSEVDIQEDIDLALIQMRAETLSRIDEAMARLASGRYGDCASCGDEIATSRLRAVPFAVRCRACEEEVEAERRLAQQHHVRRHPFDRGLEGTWGQNSAS